MKNCKMKFRVYKNKLMIKKCKDYNQNFKFSKVRNKSIAKKNNCKN